MSSEDDPSGATGTGSNPDGGAMAFDPKTDRESYLISSGALTPEQLANAKAAIARGDLAELQRRTHQADLDATETASQVASRLGITPTDVSGWRTRGLLSAYLDEGELRFPTWQFTNDARKPTLPHLTELIAATPEGMHPSSVRGIMTNVQDELQRNQVAVTPVEWLLGGGEVQDVIDIFEAYLWS